MACICSSSQFPGNAHCVGCCRSFTGESAFYKHLVVEKAVVVDHLDPVEAGLVQRKDGRWGWPAGDFQWGKS